MARVTVEDCLENVDNRFELILVASKRARDISMGSEALVDIENDKPTVLALREIAAGKITRTILDNVSAQSHAGSSIISEEEAADAIKTK